MIRKKNIENRKGSTHRRGRKKRSRNFEIMLDIDQISSFPIVARVVMEDPAHSRLPDLGRFVSDYQGMQCH